MGVHCPWGWHLPLPILFDYIQDILYFKVYLMSCPLACNPLFSLTPLGGLILPSFSWPVTLLLIHHMSPTLVKLLGDDVTGC